MSNKRYQQTNGRQRHTWLITVIVGVLLWLLVTLDSPVQSATPTAVATVPSPIATMPPMPTPFWTTWGVRQYDLADDGDSLWIGATGSVVRWDKNAKSYRRYSTVDGLPHLAVFAIAVDSAGNRWFGGDRGLSRLDANEQWQHFAAANSGLYTNTVDAIAITSDGTLYLSHGLPESSISRLDATGAWQWFPNRTAAIESDYARILQTTNRNRLWTVAGAEIWLDYAVYNGVSWQDRTPVGEVASSPDMAVDSQQRVWTIKSYDEVDVWQNGAWSIFGVDLFSFDGYLSALTVDSQDTVWIGWVERDFAYSNSSAGISALDKKYSTYLDLPGPVTKMLATAQGMWAMGPGWLRQPDGAVIKFQDVPLYPEVTDALLDSDGTLWFSSGYRAPYTVGAVQRYNDQQTLTLADDQWEALSTDTSVQVDTFEEAPNGDVWYATSCHTRAGWPMCLEVIQYHEGQKYTYNAMDYTDGIIFGGVVTDLYIQGDRHLWLGMTNSGPNPIGISHIDRGDDPFDPSDDIRTNYLVGGAASLLLGTAGRLWYGHGGGLWRYNGATWDTIVQDQPICDRVAATDDTIFARLEVAPYGCAFSMAVLVVRPDGTIEHYDQVATVIANEPDRVRSATRRNSLWEIGVDGAIWYRYADAGVHELRRVADDGSITSYPLPVTANAVQRVEIDHLNRIWMVADNRLWRFASAASAPVITATPTTTPTPPATATSSPTSTPINTSTNTPTDTPTNTPVGVPTLAPYFDVEVTVDVSKTQIMVGETITVLVTIQNQSIGCQYPVYDLTLLQQDTPLFAYVSPKVVGPPVAAQTIYTLTATTPGTVTLKASAYGERNCNDFWQWTYVDGFSASLLVIEDSSPTPTSSPTVSPTVTPMLIETATATLTPLPTMSPTPTLTATPSRTPPVATARPGDGNGDQQINEDDLTACMQEIFDGDDLFWLDAPSGDYGGTSGCDANGDTQIDAGDLSCTVRMLFAEGDACASATKAQRAAMEQAPGAALSIAPDLTATAGGQMQVPINLTTTGRAVTAVAFSLHYDPDIFNFNSAADENQDGLPDALAFQQEPGLEHIQSTVTTASGVINIALVAVAVAPQPFADGALVTVTVQVKEVGGVNGIVSTVAFSTAVPASLGSVNGQSVPVTAQDGSVQIAPLLAPIRLYLPFIIK